ncbi:MAG: D-2-hydroxyacid dehydrogenase [Verrucomicrobia bacterium]|nr:D-2-hydroxyacid dehydrogenase [Verrucomicrobiota bacterium]NBU07746.1 D-2-hydroxyacid dehydrogenase [Pseudomonadota bacterium]NDA65855.1 D-2-hydroxyacid dehydrogenase [Verrucomicrobiota bacterium]NDB76237.1 D-2-hydroxyacid dehydrogenase [Verrucomicrobiota bacterium]NDD37973.1 D-2-hydroxyacid dehydrogenase [Verrucomicrobiota bacterium]
MKIVVLDGYTLNPGDLSWADLQALAPCTVHDRTPPGEVAARCADAEIVITNKALLPREVIATLPKLKFISVTATGHNIVDTAAAKERGVPVSNVPLYGTRAVAQFTIALLLELCHHVGAHAASVRAGDWVKSADWCYARTPLLELDGLTFGVAGWGRIGQATAEIARALGMKIIAASRTPKPPKDGVEFVDLDTLFRRADVVSLHCPLTPETKGLVNAARLALMKPSAFLLNTSRGPLLDETAVAEALNNGRLAGAGLDVLSTEPPKAENPLLAAKNCLITPHQAWAAKAARARLMETTVANVKAFLAGSPQNVVNS